MPIVSGNEPPPEPKQRSGLPGWIVPLIIFGPVIYNFARSATRGLLTDQQLLIAGGGLLGLAALVAIARRVSQSRSGSAASLPTSYTPPSTPARELNGYTSSMPSAPSQYRPQLDKPYVPQPPRFEPIITGKVFLAGVVLAALMLGAGALLLG